MLCGIRDYLRKLTKTHTDQGELAHPSDGIYRVSDSDLEGLLYYILHAIDRPEQTNSGSSSPLTSNLGPRVVRPIHPIRPMASDHATTISESKASFTTDMDSPEGGLQEKQSTTKASMVSQSGITEVIWPSIRGRRMGGAAHVQPPTLPDNNDKANSIESTGLEPDWACAGTQSKSESCESCSGGQGRGSIAAATGGDEQHQQAERIPGGVQRRSSVLATLRKKSVALGQAMGSFVNGGYRNVNYRERRPSSIFRIRAILDRLEPSRPKQDVAVFSAFTGAQPIQPMDVYTARRSGPPCHTACSEDGRQHQCVQHESIETPPG